MSFGRRPVLDYGVQRSKRERRLAKWIRVLIVVIVLTPILIVAIYALLRLLFQFADGS